MRDKSQFKPGDEVRLISHPERCGVVVGEAERIAGRFWYRVRLGRERQSRHPEGDLEALAPTGDDVETLLIANRFGSRDAFSKMVTHLKLTESLRSEIYSLHASRTTFYPHQFKPLLKFLDSERHRILIADEVGLGKTIEAGLVITELRQRQSLKRVLIVPPSHLVTKWREEMRRRFDLEFDILDTGAAVRFLDRYEEEQEETSLLGILSLQAMRGRRLQERWEEVAPDFDLVVFDEAGRLRNSSSLSHAAAQRACENAEAVLLLTATPVQTGNEDLFNLLRLLDPQEFDSIDVFMQRLQANESILLAQSLLARGQFAEAQQALRNVEQGSLRERFVENPLYGDVLERLGSAVAEDRRGLVELQRDLTGLNVLGHVYSRSRKRDVETNRVVRQARAYSVQPTNDEREFYSRVTELCRETYARRGGELAAAFLSVMTQRQVASSMVALVDDWLGRTEGWSSDELLEASDLTPEDFNIEEQPLPSAGPNLHNLGDLTGWRRRLAEHDSKFEALRQALESLQHEAPHEKVVVFAFFKRTLRYLERRLTDLGVSCLRIDGDVPSDPFDPSRDERGRRIERFRSDPSVRVLLSSEVGDEGIDLQFASVLVNYDLPWNPMRIEQRIGRVDRLGQTAERITIVNLTLKTTIEDKILTRLYNRIGIFERSIGDLEEILGDEISELQQALFSPHLTDDQRVARLEQTALAIEQRRLEMEGLEREADRLLGNEQFFRDEIERARRQKRYVGGEELLIYLRDFLKAHYPTCTIEALDEPHLYRLRVSEPLRQLVVRSVAAEDLGRRQFLTRSTAGEVTLTIDQAVAEARRDIEFLTFHHPLVRAIKAYYEEHGGEIHPVSYIALRTDRVRPGRYVWFLYETEVTGARRDRELALVVCAEGSTEPLSEEVSEELLAELIVGAVAVPSGKRTISVTAEVGHAALETLATRLEARRERKRRVNDALIENRLASLRESHQRNRRIQEQRLRTARERGRKESYLRSIEGRLKNLEATYDQRRTEVDAARVLGERFDLRAAGGLEVTAAPKGPR